MTDSTILPIGEADRTTVLAMNNLHAHELSLLDRARFDKLMAEAFRARRVGALDAFMIAFDQNADYDSPNFLWFRERYPRFVYVDRIAVAVGARGRGLARDLYEDLFDAARAAGHTVVTCEINSEPPNPGSHAFHASMGFREVGDAVIHGGTKPVRYFERRLAGG